MTARKGLEARIRELSRLAPYEAAAHTDNPATRLDTNENLIIPKSVAQGALAAARRESDVRQYPETGTRRLRESLAKLVGTGPNNVIVGNGSDQILDFVLAHLLGRGSTVLVTDPTFSFFEARCALHGIKMKRIPFSDKMTVDVDELESASTDADMIYLDSPNNPTGFQFPERRLRRLIRSFERLVIVDEAYAEFGRYSLATMPKSQQNLIVTRTLSKSFGLAGLRVGYAVAPRAVADVFNRVIQYPYPISTVSVEAALAMLQQPRLDSARAAIRTTKEERTRIIDGLAMHGTIKTFDSAANFVLFDAGSAYRRIYTALLEQGISVRMIGRVGARKGCIRVTVGSREMNSRFLLAIRDLLD